MCAAQKKLFDFDNAAGPSETPHVGQFACSEKSNTEENELTVSALVLKIKASIKTTFDSTLAVSGELTNVNESGSGHLYFSLKDDKSTIDCVMWRSRASAMKFRPVDGQEVIVYGRVEVYEVRGRLQLQVDKITPKGEGALELAFRQLKEKLQREGLFDPDAKKPIPRFPAAVGVITSGSGAAIRDIHRTVVRRWPGTEIYLLPALVQGENAAPELADAVRLLDANAKRLEIDTIIIGRGGGSLEDLWAFNEEVLARAVFDAVTPIISGVGHEVDITICDLVADYRAATPTAAAEAAVPDGEEFRRYMDDMQYSLRRLVEQKLEMSRMKLQTITRCSFFADPTSRLRTEAQRIDELAVRLSAIHPGRMLEKGFRSIERLSERLRWSLGSIAKNCSDRLAATASRMAASHPRHKLALLKERLQSARKRLETTDHKRTLARGFTITRDSDGEIITSSKSAAKAETLITEFGDGSIKSTPS